MAGPRNMFRDSLPMSNELSYCGRLGKSDVELHLKVASTIRRCEACGVMILFSMICLPGAVRT
jgi:hypothetical protein